MQKNRRSPVLACAALMFTLALAGCGNMSKVDERGESGTLAWPDIKQATRAGGSYPDPAHLAMVKAGMSKYQLYDLLGPPHFHEGMLMVREWDYLFHLRTPTGDQLCQYKVLFDRNRVVAGVHWRTPSCAAAAKDAPRAAIEDGMPAAAGAARHA
ncbi:hypothetical protein AKI39_03075 [Bordetella sp. H567]|uniref:outer membrane protein assembly factor BamE n=1 Tax=Bordetella sp. H567 TaxID=1697043 RepID=UPI00081D1DD9|nr:outer membrane protein assembly factor BamE [Bordetella sp. H567]AOB29890.1 hypothetical protein AKI39_03075 [Bordetella sp. H567]